MALNYVEDVIKICNQYVYDIGFRQTTSEWFQSFTANIYLKVVRANKPLTTEQGKATLKLLAKVRSFLIERGESALDIDRLLANPVYKHPPTLSANVPREVRYLGSNILAFRFKWNDVIKNRLLGLAKNMLSFEEAVEWDWTKKITTVPVTSRNVEAIQNIISEFKFDFDDEVAACLAEAHNQDDSAVVAACTNDAIEVYAPNALVAAWCNRILRGKETSQGLYRFPLIPGVARRLMKLPTVLQSAVIDQTICDLAEQDRVDPSLPNADAIQELLDFDLRAILNTRSHSAAHYALVGTAAKLAGIKYLVMHERHNDDSYFIALAALLGFAPDAVRLMPRDEDQISTIRDEALAIITEYEIKTMHEYKVEMCEFPQLVVIVNPAYNNVHLFEHYPTRNEIFTLDRKYMAAASEMGFNDLISAKYTFMFNTLNAPEQTYDDL